MEPGHEDREYQVPGRGLDDVLRASMEPGHEDREYAMLSATAGAGSSRLNGARS